MWTVELLVVAGMVALNSVFAAYEIALASVGTGRLHTLVESRRRGAASALRMKQKIEASLAVVQIGITLVGATAAATSGAGAEETIEPILRQWGMSFGVAQFLAIAIVVAPLVVVTILLGELVPKVFALRNKEWVCLTLSPVMEWFSWLVFPAVWFLEGAVNVIMSLGRESRCSPTDEAQHTAQQELRSAASLARTARLIGRREEGIIVSASRLADTELRRVMLPAPYIGMLCTTQTVAEALVVAHQEMHTRFPITQEAGNPQRIIGYVNFKDLVAALRTSPSDASLSSLVRRLPSFDADMSAADCLEQLIRKRNHIALVRDSDGKILGMVTLEDIVEEVIGEIHDEYDRIPAHLAPVGNGWIAGGFILLSELRAKTGIELPSPSEKPLYNLSDWIVERLGRPPRGGDEIRTDTCRILVRKMRGVLVQEAYLNRIDESATSVENSAAVTAENPTASNGHETDHPQGPASE